MPVLKEADLQAELATMPGWSVKDGQITRTYQLASFPFAIEFVRQIGDLAEAAMHHPDIDIRFDKVTIAVNTHDEGGITEKDIGLARQIDSLLEAYGGI